ncbi:hypothetical protein EB093_02015 [bacterium]|nr:hypothetical protein [bacterium]
MTTPQRTPPVLFQWPPDHGYILLDTLLAVYIIVAIITVSAAIVVQVYRIPANLAQRDHELSDAACRLETIDSQSTGNILRKSVTIGTHELVRYVLE